MSWGLGFLALFRVFGALGFRVQCLTCRGHTHTRAPERDRERNRPEKERDRERQRERDKERQSQSRRVDSGVQSSGFGV